MPLCRPRRPPRGTVESPETTRPANDAEPGFVRRRPVRWLDPQSASGQPGHAFPVVLRCTAATTSGYALVTFQSCALISGRRTSYGTTTAVAKNVKVPNSSLSLPPHVRSPCLLPNAFSNEKLPSVEVNVPRNAVTRRWVPSAR